MSMLMCYLAVEKPKDGKKFTVCEVGTWFYLEAFFMKTEDFKRYKEELKRLYNLFGNGEDKTEKGISLADLKKLSKKSNGGIYIIPKESDKLISINDWKSYEERRNSK